MQSLYRAMKTIHLINPLWAADAGSEIHTLRIYELLKAHTDVRLWSQHELSADLSKSYPISRIVPRSLQFPKLGTFVFIGSYFMYGSWLRLTFPRRVIVLYNTHDDGLLKENLQRLRWPQLPEVEMIYASQELADGKDLSGIVELSPIDPQRFKMREPLVRSDRQFTVGRLSRDAEEKHHLPDRNVYERLVEAGCAVRIMGGMSLREEHWPTDSIELLPTLSEDPVTFLHSLDCFYYRTSDEWPEPYGRVVFEAMACGLPVVVHSAGGFARYIQAGVNGFVFDTEDEALSLILKLKAEPSLRARVGRAARDTIQRMYGEAFEDEITKFYLS